MAQLSPRRQQILNFIRRFIDEKGYAPTFKEILDACGISSYAVVQHHLKVLEREGYIRRAPEAYRSITLTERVGHTVRVPLLGYIAAGEPIPVPQSDTWVQEPLEVLDIPGEIAHAGDNVYALRVKGLSMIDALIDDGDIVVMQATNTVDDGDMAAVLLKEEQEVTLKRIYRGKGRVRLQPANRLMQPLYCQPENIEIQGKVVGVIRKL